MATLLLINGLPGVGKSMIAQRYVDDHPGALNLDIDRLRRMLGGWRDDPAAAGRAARVLALAAARAHLAAGHDVVVPQFLGRPEFVGQLAEAAQATGADFREIVLTADPAVVAERFARRSREAVDPIHLDAASLLEEAGGLAGLPALHDRLLTSVTDRPDARLIAAPQGRVDDTYQAVLAAVTRAHPPGP